MDLEPHENSLLRMDPFAVNYGQLLKHVIPGNSNITSVEEIDSAITIFT
jgi:hypothetical protein